MEMKITVKKLKRMTIEEFAILHDLTMCVVERYSNPGTYFLAAFEDMTIMPNVTEIGNCVPIISHGQGSTPEEAIQNYAKHISTKRLRSNLTKEILSSCPLFINKEGKVL